jgi:hypothetical protein
MRYIVIIAFLFIGCKASSPTTPGKPNLFVLLIEFNKGADAENHIMQVLTNSTTLQLYEIRR